MWLMHWGKTHDEFLFVACNMGSGFRWLWAFFCFRYNHSLGFLASQMAINSYMATILGNVSAPSRCNCGYSSNKHSIHFGWISRLNFFFLFFQHLACNQCIEVHSTIILLSTKDYGGMDGGGALDKTYKLRAINIGSHIDWLWVDV